MTDYNVKRIDVSAAGGKEEIACYLFQAGDQNILFDCGPQSQIESLRQGLKSFGLMLSDIQHVMLSHIHLDHAGSAWSLAKAGAKIYLHPYSAPHFQDITKFYASVQRIYQTETKNLWGELQPIAADNLVTVEDGESFKFGDVTLRAHYSPGHAKHHIVWQLGPSIIFGGDALGCCYNDGPVLASAPPPDLDFEQWEVTLRKIEQLNAKKVFLTHFGDFAFDESFRRQLRKSLQNMKEIGKLLFDNNYRLEDFNLTVPLKVKELVKDKELKAPSTYRQKYDAMSPAWMNYQGMLKYWQNNIKD